MRMTSSPDARHLSVFTDRRTRHELEGADMTSPPRPSVAGSDRQRLRVNITPAERVGRVLIGSATAIAAVVLLTSAGSIVAVVLEVLFLAAALDLVVTGAIGHCPLYQKLGHMPRSLRSTP